MNKSLLMIIALMSVLLAACGGSSSWEDEQVVEVSDRIMSDMVQANWAVGEEDTDGTPITIELKNESGEPIEEFDLNHEKLLHFIVISKDLSYFNHIHPEYEGKGVFKIRNEFPAGGEYRFIADFKPTGGDSMTKMDWISVAGERTEARPIAASSELTDSSHGKQVTLAVTELGANEETTLTFSITDEATGQPINNLQPYLGAIGHVVVLSEDGERYVHVHAEGDQGTGPEAVFEATFPTSGLYKIWGQFQHKDEVFTVDYVVNVP
ncbi:hypothetical protein MO973_13220 [Paenibacillus sp. TRM 82003]|nr:hypothetical protein [Paenibacillus sp. TRM 82003]